ncbi:hypothetical protein M8R20_16570 [Pseudomonas sp. R2.Fl]|nr:hypothetical protein [Pseudomonas sp. R2.Fl]
MLSHILSRLLAAVKAWDAIQLAVALTVFGFLVWPGWLNDAREAGALGERLVWMEKQRRMDIKLEADRKAAQAKIDAAELSMINAMAESAIRTSELERAIAEEKANAKDDPVGGVAACPAMPERVRNALNGIGGRHAGEDGARQ